ncbi:hypothetical protein X965_14635 [Morganella sp. EGD-HP17]|nr:hypothetical protein X965_14635 [Morganella sp. EGD-HP17]
MACLGCDIPPDSMRYPDGDFMIYILVISLALNIIFAVNFFIRKSRHNRLCEKMKEPLTRVDTDRYYYVTDDIALQNVVLKDALQVYKSFFNSVVCYAGTYPAWKVLFEFQEAVRLNKNTEQVNRYLDKLVSEVQYVLDETDPAEAERWRESVRLIRYDIAHLKSKKRSQDYIR